MSGLLWSMLQWIWDFRYLLEIFFFFLDIYTQKCEFLNHMVVLFLIFEKALHCSPGWFPLFTSPPTVHRGFLFPTSSPTLISCHFETSQTWVSANCGRWWRTGKPSMLQSTGRRVGHDWRMTKILTMWGDTSLWFRFAFPWFWTPFHVSAGLNLLWKNVYSGLCWFFNMDHLKLS